MTELVETMRSTALQAPPEWVNRKYYEIQCTEAAPTRRKESPLPHIIEVVKVGLGTAAAYVVIVVMIILLS